MTYCPNPPDEQAQEVGKRVLVHGVDGRQLSHTEEECRRVAGDGLVPNAGTVNGHFSLGGILKEEVSRGRGSMAASVLAGRAFKALKLDDSDPLPTSEKQGSVMDQEAEFR